MSGSTPKGPKNLSDDDAALFDAAMRDVEAIEKTEKEPLTPTKKKPGKKAPSAGPREPALPSGPAPARLAHLQAGQSGDVDTRTMERLRRGRVRPEARLDLHGLTQPEAHRALSAFLPSQREAGRRCILVITGKGRVSEGGGVLRNQLPNWINTPELRPHVIGYAEAQPRDGGAGAVYVLLRRVRKNR